MPIKPVHFYMIRHGETEANAARLMAGSLDSPLTPKGINQAHETRKIIDALETKPQTIVHSNLSRARDTAAILNENLAAPLAENPDIAELHAGDWEGVPYDVCPGLLSDWINPPGGETFEQFFARIIRGKNDIFHGFPTPVMIVCHGGVFRALGKIYGMYSQGVDNCTLYEFIPASSKNGFPWEVWEYSWQEKLIRVPAMIYSCSDEEMAS